MQAEGENVQQECTNCMKPFPTDKIDLHEAYCCRNIRKCTHCSDMVDMKDIDEHIVKSPSFRPMNIPRNHVPTVHSYSSQMYLLSTSLSALVGLSSANSVKISSPSSSFSAMRMSAGLGLSPAPFATNWSH